MRIASILCFCAATVQVLIGFLLVLFNTPMMAFAISFGISVWVYVGGLLVLTGMATYLAGAIVGFLGLKQPDASSTIKAFTALNGAFLGFLLFMTAVGFVMQQAQTARQHEVSKKYADERADKRLQFAESFTHTYHQHLWDHHILLLNTSTLSAKMVCSEIAGMTLVVVPTIDWQTDKAGDQLLDKNSYFQHLLVRKFLETNDTASFAAMKTFFTDSEISYALDLEEADGGFKSLRDQDFDWFANKDVVIKRITAKLEWEDQYRATSKP
jgi:hypothetical protein